VEIPAWANVELSQDLPALRASGEGWDLEYKRELPAQAHEIATEIAAFATSGGGRILIGVSDTGELVGLDAASADAADKLRLRAQGILKNVRPGVKADVLVGSEDGKTVLYIRLGKQDEPIYYYDYRPYIRVGTMSRPAEPEEVKERVWAHPSSEFKRKTEEIEIRRRQAYLEHEIRRDEDFANQLRADQQQAVERRQAYARQSDETTDLIRKRLLGG
jgi:predicted HTH transcriptional regulator